MSVTDHFNRRETMELTGATSNQLQYLERSEFVIPTRVWNCRKKPDVYYSWEQILEIRAICNLRQVTSLQVIRKVLNFFENCLGNKSLRDKQIVVVDNEVFWVKHDWSDFGQQISTIKIAGKNNKRIGQYTLLVIPALKDVVDEIWEAAAKSNIINIKQFKRRAKLKSTKIDRTA